MNKDSIKGVRTGRGSLLAALCVAACLAGISTMASTCIVSYPEGDRDPKSSLASSSVAVDAGAGTVTVLDSLLEARFQMFLASPGIALTTMPLGFQFSIR